MYRSTRLENGLTVATAEMPHMASVSLGVWVGTGGRYEPAELNGVSHFIEHLLFKGTRRRSARDISNAIEGVGGYINAFTTEETTCFYAKAQADRFPELLDVLLDMFLEPRFAPPDIKKERTVIKEELALYLDQPQHQVQESLNQLLWPNHPLGRSLTGTFQSIDRISRAQMLRYRSVHYVASNTLVAVAGRIRHEQALARVGAYGRRFAQGRPPPYQPAAPDSRAPRLEVLRKKTNQLQLALGFPVCSRHDDRRFPLRLLNTLLGENMSSRLFQSLREDHGLAYSIHSGLNLLDDVGALVISAGLDPGRLPKALKLIARELHRCRKYPPTARELRQARDYLIGQLDLSLESSENQMTWIGEHALAYRRIIPPQQIKQCLRETTPGDVRRVATEYLRPERLQLALVSPRREKDQLLRFLRF